MRFVFGWYCLPSDSLSRIRRPRAIESGHAGGHTFGELGIAIWLTKGCEYDTVYSGPLGLGLGLGKRSR